MHSYVHDLQLEPHHPLDLDKKKPLKSDAAGLIACNSRRSYRLDPILPMVGIIQPTDLPTIGFKLGQLWRKLLAIHCRTDDHMIKLSQTLLIDVHDLNF